MTRIAQMGIALGMFGIVVTLMGLFPGVIGFAPTPGIGVMQILIMNVGLTLLIFGALIYVRFTFYARAQLTLVQQVGIRLSLTGLTFAALGSLADVLGFGSNSRLSGEEIFFGPIQIFGLIACLGVASLGVIVFALGGEPSLPDETR